MKIEIGSNLVAALLGWIYSGEDRPGLDQLAIGHDLIRATNGHKYVCLPFKTHGEKPLAIRRRTLVAALAAQDAITRDDVMPIIPHDVYEQGAHWSLTDGARGDRKLVLETKPKSEVVAVHVGDVEAFHVADKLGDYNKVPPLTFIDEQLKSAKPEDVIGATFSPALMAGISPVLQALGEENRGVRLHRWGGSTLSPIELVSFSGARFIVMPMRGHNAP